MAPRGNWNYPSSIRFGPGRIQELPNACREIGVTRPLIVTDPQLAKLPLVFEVVDIVEGAGLPTEVFCAIKPNPIGQNVQDGVAAYRRGAHDGVIALGGGSALDAAKAVALMVGQQRPLWDFEDVNDWWTRADERGMAPVVAVPTTAGTGSEVGRVSVIVDEQARKKKLIFHPKLVPARVICDPELTIGMSARLTAAVGMDALSHNLEAYCSSSFHPLADGIALEGMRLVSTSLREAVKDGSDIAARSRMLAASTMGATAFQKGLGAMHAIAHPLGARFDTHHGTTVAVLMPYVLHFNRGALGPRMSRLASYLGLPDLSVDGVISWVLQLRADLGIPHTLPQLGVNLDDPATLAEEAAADPSGATNPVPLTREALQGLIELACRGELPLTAPPRRSTA